MSSSSSAAFSQYQRCVAHIDMDCFYVQVERVRDQSLLNIPVVVNQYNPFGDLRSVQADENRKGYTNGSAIAVSYEARARGVKRNMRGAEMKKVCPELTMVTVPVAHGKADLSIYRAAGNSVIDLLKRKVSCVIEKASIDEVYLDLTEEVHKRLCRQDFGRDILSVSKMHCFPLQGIKDEDRQWLDRDAILWKEEDRILAVGAVMVAELRESIAKELGFTCSAGIAHNKLMAKFGSSMHKPNKQIVVYRSCIPKLLKDLPLKKLRGFGGKLGADLMAKMNIDTVSQLLLFSESALVDEFGEATARWVLESANGIDNEPVADRTLPKSIGCSKTFRMQNEIPYTSVRDGSILHWLTELASELLERVATDNVNYGRFPRLFVVGITAVQKASGSPTKGHDRSKTHLSKSCPMPPLSTCTAEMLASLAAGLIKKAVSSSLKIHATMETSITVISMNANHFDDDESKTNKCISDFFAAVDTDAVVEEFRASPAKLFPPSQRASTVPKNDRNLKHFFETNVSPVKLFPPSQRASTVPKNDRNLKHFFEAEVAGPSSLPPSSALTTYGKTEKPPNKKFKVSDLLVSQYTSKSVQEHNASSWSCKRCTFENHCELQICEMCEDLRN